MITVVPFGFLCVAWSVWTSGETLGSTRSEEL